MSPWAPCSACWVPMSVAVLGPEAVFLCRSPCSAGAYRHPHAMLTSKGDPIRKVISLHDSSFSSLSHGDTLTLTEIAACASAGRSQSDIAEDPAIFFPTPHSSVAPQVLPMLSRLASQPPCCGEPFGSKMLTPSVLTLAHASPPVSTGGMRTNIMDSQSPIPSAASPLCQPQADPSSHRYFRGLHSSPWYLASGRQR